MKYQPNKIERKWQRYWAKQKLYEIPDQTPGKENYMLLTEFPYPSGDLHMGHWWAFSVPDILARYLRMCGRNIMYPIGFDAFGLPAENAAIKHGTHPRAWTEKNIATMTKQLNSMGASFDWSRAVSTIDPEYYRWTQWIFLKMHEKGLAYRAATKVNWCPKDKTVLANEQVIDGKCERDGEPVIQKELEQWMFKTTAYADRLVDDIEDLDWPDFTKTAQRNWIGRSEGAIIKFSIALPDFATTKSLRVGNFQFSIDVFTTRADTLFGATYIVLAPEHPLAGKIAADTHLNAVTEYQERVRHKTERERLQLEKEKTGVFTGAFAINPANGEEIPIWIADYVLGHYGTGAVMAVPAHDERDFEFAQKYKLTVKTVISPDLENNSNSDDKRQAFVDDGWLVNSGEFDGMKSSEARKKITEHLTRQKKAYPQKNYKLHDWVLSRQRYWGVPIPMIYCSECALRDPLGRGYVPVPEKDLPVKLPKLNDFLPVSGRSPLARAKKWLNVKCPACGSAAERETDTMDTFVDSSWYFIRYADPRNDKEFASKEKMDNWLPVPMYVGGAEHNTMHLLYSRFFTKVLYDLGLVGFNEPFISRRNHGVILGSDGNKMSKSRGNVINPDEQVATFGADTVRMYLAFTSPYEQGGPWDPSGINGIFRFLNRVFRLFLNLKIKIKKSKLQIKNQNENQIDRAIHRAIKKIGQDIEKLSFNTGVSELMKLLNIFEKNHSSLTASHCSLFTILLAPFAPHLAEEIWSRLSSPKKATSQSRILDSQSESGHVLRNYKSIHLQPWPQYDPTMLVEDKIKIPVQINGKVRDILNAPAGISEDEARQSAMELDNVKRHLTGKAVKKFIYIPGKMISIVV